MDAAHFAIRLAGMTCAGNGIPDSLGDSAIESAFWCSELRIDECSCGIHGNTAQAHSRKDPRIRRAGYL
ncbi:MAG TPA: hypothetical protein VN107_10025, partial [Microbacterium sp.]|nr:hypothetical protein [Microbacterium sp.]